MLAVSGLLAACGSSNSSNSSTGTGGAATGTSSSGQNQSANASGHTRGGVDPGEVIVWVGQSPITRTQLSHWMDALGASLFFADSGGRTIPEGLLSDPTDLARCVSSLEAAAATAPENLHESPAELLARCRQLNQAFKGYATHYLIEIQQTVQLAKQFDVNITPAKVQALFRQIAAREYPTTSALHAYLASHHRTVKDLLLEAEVSLIGQELYPKLKTVAGRNKLLSFRAHLITETACSFGYRVEGCKKHNKAEGSYGAPTPPSVLMEQLIHSA